MYTVSSGLTILKIANCISNIITLRYRIVGLFESVEATVYTIFMIISTGNKLTKMSIVGAGLANGWAKIKKKKTVNLATNPTSLRILFWKYPNYISNTFAPAYKKRSCSFFLIAVC